MGGAGEKPAAPACSKEKNKMSKNSEPNPSTRRSEDFPKTTTMPDGWSMDALMDAYNGCGERADHIRAEELMEPVPVPTTGGPNGKARPQTAETEELFNRRLEPFASDNTGMWL